MVQKKYFIQFCQVAFNNADEIIRMINLLEEIVYPEKMNFYLVDPGIPKSIDNLKELLQDSIKKNVMPIFSNGKENNHIALSFTNDPYTRNELHFSSISFKVPYSDVIDELIFSKISLIVSAINIYNVYVTHPKQNYSFADHRLSWGMEHVPVKIKVLPVITNKVDPGIKPWEYPVYFAWINFWSKTVVEKVGLKYDHDKALFYKSFLLDNGGVLFQLTQEPLNIDNQEHLEIVRKCYERFDRVGNQYMLK